ncbi:ribosomal protein L1 [Trichodelitschia bisporula]|uniref:Ribosomal protein L1 n=1 Tax=Trichodelitschia bisporula TaxID=703511 RepID=A0A6G1I9V1_9PEZI|nr:ribosomal protein L1 [Trichodelitschia bisporula]
MASSTPVVEKPQSRSPYSLDKAQTLRAVQALKSHVERASKTEEKKPSLLEEDEESTGKEVPIWLVMTAKKHISDTKKLKPGKIPVPHSLWQGASQRICIITADPPASNTKVYKELVKSPLFPADLAKQIVKVVSMGKIKSKFRAFEGRRQLLAEHDMFLADERIVHMLPTVLGSTFYRSTTKRPVPVCLTGKETWGKKDEKKDPLKPKPKRTKEEGGPPTIGAPADVGAAIQKALDSTLVHLSQSPTTSVRVGWASWPAEHLVANVDTVVEGLTSRFIPKGWHNVRAIHIKTPDSAALPIWLTEELWTDEDQVLDTVPKPVEPRSKKRKSDPDAPMSNRIKGQKLADAKRAVEKAEKKRRISEQIDRECEEAKKEADEETVYGQKAKMLGDIKKILEMPGTTPVEAEPAETTPAKGRKAKKQAKRAKEMAGGDSGKKRTA